VDREQADRPPPTRSTHDPAKGSIDAHRSEFLGRVVYASFQTYNLLSHIARFRGMAATPAARRLWGLMNSDLIQFVETSFGSVWSLELLLLLFRDPQRHWTYGELVHELRSSEVVVAQSVERLMAAGLAVAEAGRLRPLRAGIARAG
jgi:hypothetical protein